MSGITCGWPDLAKYISHSAKVSKTFIIRKTRQKMIRLDYIAETFLCKCFLPQTVANDIFAYLMLALRQDRVFYLFIDFNAARIMSLASVKSPLAALTSFCASCGL